MRNWGEVKAICEKATEEPWELAGCNGELTGINGPSGYDHEMGVIPGQLEVYGGDDAVFISVTRTALPEAVAEIEQLRQEKAELVDVLKEAVPPESCVGWWCPTCKEVVNGVQVTFSEHHEACGTFLGGCQVDNWADRARNLLARLDGGEPNAKP